MGQSLLEVLRNLALDAGERSAFASDPAGYLDDRGYGDVPAEDLREAVDLMADTLPPEVARTVAPGGGMAGDDAGSSLVEALEHLERNGTSNGPPVPDEPPDPGENLTTGFGDADFDSGIIQSPDPGETAGDASSGDGPDGDSAPHGDARGAPDPGDPEDAGEMAFGTGSAPASTAMDASADATPAFGEPAATAPEPDLESGDDGLQGAGPDLPGPLDGWENAPDGSVPDHDDTDGDHGSARDAVPDDGVDAGEDAGDLDIGAF